MQVRGHDKFDSNFYVEADDDRYLIRIDDGQVADVMSNPVLNQRWQFGVEGSHEAWEEFVQETPPTFNHEIIVSNYRAAVKGESGRLYLATYAHRRLGGRGFAFHDDRVTDHLSPRTANQTPMTLFAFGTANPSTVSATDTS